MKNTTIFIIITCVVVVFFFLTLFILEEHYPASNNSNNHNKLTYWKAFGGWDSTTNNSVSNYVHPPELAAEQGTDNHSHLISFRNSNNSKAQEDSRTTHKLKKKKNDNTPTGLDNSATAAHANATVDVTGNCVSSYPPSCDMYPYVRFWKKSFNKQGM
jgi:hypothetical protein